MKTFFATIGFVVVALWSYHFWNNSPMAKKTVRIASESAWNATAPYINDAVNKAQKHK